MHVSLLFFGCWGEKGGWVGLLYLTMYRGREGVRGREGKRERERESARDVLNPDSPKP